MFNKIQTLKILTALVMTVMSFSAHAQNNPYQASLSDWAATLERFVDEQGRTDFVALSKDTVQLQRFVDAVGQVSPQSNPELFPSSADVLAYHVNTYNALAMKGVIERGIPKKFSNLLKRASFFKFRSVIIGGKKTNLYDYENKVIRPLGDARVHFVLNCMVVDCPRLPTTIFTPQRLEQDLQAASVEFFSKPKHIQINAEKKTVYLSGILKFYTKDYVPSGKKQDLVEYVNQFRSNKIPQDYKVKFLDYNWTINQQPVLWQPN